MLFVDAVRALEFANDADCDRMLVELSYGWFDGKKGRKEENRQPIAKCFFLKRTNNLLTIHSILIFITFNFIFPGNWENVNCYKMENKNEIKRRKREEQNKMVIRVN